MNRLADYWVPRLVILAGIILALASLFGLVGCSSRPYAPDSHEEKIEKFKEQLRMF
jgi:hypothetical protein